jgi:hypothetical protein
MCKLKIIIGFSLGMLTMFIADVVLAQSKVSIVKSNDEVIIKNDKVNLAFNIKNGLFSLSKADGEKVIENAYFQAGGLQSSDLCENRTWTQAAFTDELGTGKALIIKQSFVDYADILWKVCLYNDKSYYIFQMGIDNDVNRPYQLINFYPLITKKAYNGKNNTLNYRVLDGNGGGSPTKVTDTADLTSFNNVLVKFGEVSHPDILVAGGITYHEFEKFAKVSRTKSALQLSLYSSDPVGRRIDAGQQYWPDEKFYVCFEDQNPFEALEQYATVLKAEQHIALNHYDFLTECLWYASFYNRDSTRAKFNNTKGAVEEMDNAIKSGITEYTKVAIRLVPDAYGPENQQGWWDDEHWRKYNEPMSTDLPHYTAPYLTTTSWTKAIKDKGGYPFTYMQSGRRSEDFIKLHPDWMLFNDPYRAYSESQRPAFLPVSSYFNPFIADYSRHWWSEKQLWGYDFTDAGFIRHMQGVYANMKKAGIKGIFYDYPENTAWAYEGGFDNKYATTAWAYRQMFKLAKDGLGDDVLLQERNIARGSDIAIGLVSSQRVWGDNDIIVPDMVSMCGLRWYKNRVVMNYDMDAKDPNKAKPVANADGERAMFTMCYVASGRFLLGRSFNQLSKKQLYDLSRTFPYHTTLQSARPIDAFNNGVTIPRVYDFAVNPSWHQLTFYNYNTTNDAATNTISVFPAKSLNEGGMALDPQKQYYVYDFWNDTFIGLIKVTDKLEQQLRPGESRMMSVHARENNPQFISTNRHIMQGYLDLKDCKWNASTKILSGIATVIKDDPFKITIATNGKKISSCRVSGGTCAVKMKDEKNGLAELEINTPANADIKWELRFK